MIGVHGSVLAKKVSSYRLDREILHFKKCLEAPTQVDTLGTGTIAYNTELVRFNPLAWQTQNQADLLLAIEMRRRNIPLVAIQREANWLQPIAEDQSDSTWRGLKRDDSKATYLAQLLAAMPNIDECLIVDICGEMVWNGKVFLRS